MQDLMRNLLLGGGGGFSPQSLFTGGVEGALYDPSDLSTLYQDSAGTTPVTGVEQVVGLMLDKSQGLVLGANDITGFTPTIVGTATAATYNGTTGAGTAARVNGSNLSYLSKTGLTSNRVYRITVTNTGSSNFEVRQNGYAISLFIVTPGATVTGLVTTYTHTDVSIVPNTNGTTIAFTIVSFQQVSGNHATSTGSARPTLSARVNLLTYSEEFDNGAWLKLGGAISANTTLAPDGTTTADTFTAAATFVRHGVLNTGAPVLLPANTPVAFSAYIRKGNYDFVSLLVTNGITTWFRATFDFSGASPVLSQSANGAGGTYISASVEAAANGFWRLVVRGSTTDTTLYGEICLNSSATPPSQNYGEEIWTAAGTETVIVWGADLRPANIGVNIPSYQRIAAATNYDTNGFPFYLSFGGAQSMSTPANLDLTSTDKVTVFAGVRKLSDAARGIVAELSATTASNNGSFRLAAPEDATFDYSMTSRGTLDISAAINSSIYAAPNTSVLTGTADISAPPIALRINGAQVAANSTSQGTGNYGTYPLYIGARNNASTWFTGYLYSLIIQGAAASATQLASTEAWVNQKTKAY